MLLMTLIFIILKSEDPFQSKEENERHHFCRSAAQEESIVHRFQEVCLSVP